MSLLGQIVENLSPTNECVVLYQVGPVWKTLVLGPKETAVIDKDALIDGVNMPNISLSPLLSRGEDP